MNRSGFPWGGWNWVPLFPAHAGVDGTGFHYSQHLAGVDGTGFHYSQHIAGVDGTRFHYSQHIARVDGTRFHYTQGMDRYAQCLTLTELASFSGDLSGKLVVTHILVVM